MKWGALLKNSKQSHTFAWFCYKSYHIPIAIGSLMAELLSDKWDINLQPAQDHTSKEASSDYSLATLAHVIIIQQILVQFKKRKWLRCKNAIRAKKWRFHARAREQPMAQNNVNIMRTFSIL